MTKSAKRTAFPFYGHGLPTTELLIWFETAAPDRSFQLDAGVTIEAIGPRALRVAFQSANANNERTTTGPEWLAARNRFERSVLQLNDVCRIACVIAAPLSELDSVDDWHATSLLTLERDTARIADAVTEQPGLAYEALTWLAVYADSTKIRPSEWIETIVRLNSTFASRLGSHAWSARCDFVATIASAIAREAIEEWCRTIPFVDQLALALRCSHWESALVAMPAASLQRWLLDGHERLRDGSEAEVSFCLARAMDLASRWFKDAYKLGADTSTVGPPARSFQPKIASAAVNLVATLAELESALTLARAMRLALLAGLERWDELDTHWSKDAQLLSQHVDEAQMVLAEALRCSRTMLIKRWLDKLADSQVCHEPLVLGNVLYALNTEGRFAESSQRAALHLLEGRGLTPIVITNALNAFAGARRWDVLVAAFAQRVERLLDADEGAYFLPTATQQPDLRGSAHAHLALAYGTCGDEERVVHHLQRAAALRFEDLAMLAYTSFFSAMANRPSIKAFFASLEGSTTGARDAAVARNPNDWWPIFVRGLEAHNRGDLALAIADYQCVIELAPHYADTYINMGNIRWTAHNDLLGAIEWYARALALAPLHVHGLCNRGDALIRLERFGEAARDLELVLSLDPGLALAHYLLAVAHAAGDSVDAAAQSAKTGASLDPDMKSVDADAPYRECLLQILNSKQGS
jgi:tetratricopeptide (TPR) repeat protein